MIYVLEFFYPTCDWMMYDDEQTAKSNFENLGLDGYWYKEQPDEGYEGEPDTERFHCTSLNTDIACIVKYGINPAFPPDLTKQEIIDACQFTASLHKSAKPFLDDLLKDIMKEAIEVAEGSSRGRFN